jgi:hypothetical protein
VVDMLLNDDDDSGAEMANVETFVRMMWNCKGQREQLGEDLYLKMQQRIFRK